MVKILIMVKILRTREVPQSLPRSCLYCIAHPETRKGKKLFVKQIVFLNKSVPHTFGLNNILFIKNTYMLVQYIMVQNLIVSKVLICKPSPGYM